MHNLPATDPGGSLFSHNRPGKSTPKKIRGFMGLPGELRNRVYDHYFQDDFRCEMAAKGHDFTQPKHSPLQPQPNVPATLRVSRLLGKYNLIKGQQTNWSTSHFTLTLVCKQVHMETVTYVYKKTIYVFAAPSRIINFLNNITKPNLQHITKLHLHYSTYGEPKLYRELTWQAKHVESWRRACRAVSKKLVNLRELDVWVHVSQWAPTFNLHEIWLQPILELRRLTQKKKCDPVSWDSVQTILKTVNVHFLTSLSTHNDTFDDPELTKASDHLHVLFGRAISSAILGAKEKEAMAEFYAAWNGKYSVWRYHLGYASSGW